MMITNFYIGNNGSSNTTYWMDIVKCIYYNKEELFVVCSPEVCLCSPLSHVYVEFADYINDEKRIINYMKNASIGFVLSSDCETISFAFIEMMACSLPVIVSNFGRLPESIDYGVNGWSIKTGSEISIHNNLELSN